MTTPTPRKVLWMPFAEALPSAWAYSARDRGGEPAWRYNPYPDPDPNPNQLLRSPNFYATPHIGAATYEAQVGPVGRTR